MDCETSEAWRDLIWTPRKSPQGYYFPLLVYYNQHFISADYEELFAITGRATPSSTTRPRLRRTAPNPPVVPHTFHDKCVLFFLRRRRVTKKLPRGGGGGEFHPFRVLAHMRNCPAAVHLYLPRARTRRIFVILLLLLLCVE